MRTRGLLWLNAVFPILPVALLANATVEGRVELPKSHSAPVQAKRYQIVTKGGVLSTQPPLAVVYLDGPFPQPASLPTKQVRQKDLTFIPSLLPVRFGTPLFTAMMVIVATLTGLGFYLAQQKVTADAERNLQQSFQAELSSMHSLEELRHATLADRCDTLATKSRIHAAIEDNAIDLLYPSAKDELRDLMEGDEPPPEKAARSLHAKFYRFLDTKGAVIKPLNPSDV